MCRGRRLIRAQQMDDLKSLQHSLYGDVEDDADLLAELAALSGEKPKPKAKPPPQKQVTPAMLSKALQDEQFEFDDEDLENDEDLQNELAGMMDDDDVAPPPAPARGNPSPQKRAAASPPPLPARGVPPVPPPADAPPPLPQRVASVTEPLVTASAPSRVSAPIDTPAPAAAPDASESEGAKVRHILRKRHAAYTLNLKAAQEANDLPNAKEFMSMVEMFQQALSAAEETDLTLADLGEVPKTPPPYRKKVARSEPTNLMEDLENRYHKCLEMAEDYMNKGEAQRARMQTRNSGRFKEAINELKRGRKVNLEELPLVVGLPKLTDMPYAKVAVVAPAGPSSAKLPAASSSSAAGPSVAPSKPPQTNVSPKPMASHQKPNEVVGDTAEKNQLRFLLTRQQQFKEAALTAKKTGDLAMAKEMLLNAKKMEPMIQASEGGMPVDIRNVPVPPQSGLSRGLMRQFSLGADDSLQEVEKALLSQITTCDSQRAAFNDRNDSRSVMIYEKLLSETRMDLLHFREVLKVGRTPKVKVIDLALPSLNVTAEKGITDEVIEVKVIGITKLKVPDNYKPHHLNVYLKYTFNFPHDAPQSGKTSAIAGSDNPEFNELVQLKINRKARQLVRVIRRVPLKFEVYQKGSFLRSDKLWGTADVSLVALEKQSLLTVEVDVLEGRKKTGGKLAVQVRVSRPITESDASAGNNGARQQQQQAPTSLRKWVRVDRGQ